MNIIKKNTLWWPIAAMMFVTISVHGQTNFSTLQGPPKARNENDIAVSADGTTLYSTDKSVLFKSINSGSSWAATGVEIGSPLVVTCKPDLPDVVITGVATYLYRNTTGGSSAWSPVLTDGTLAPLRLAVSPLNSQDMYLGRQYVTANISFWYSSNGGSSWAARSNFSYATSVYDVAPYPIAGSNRNDDVWAVGSDGTTEGTNPQTAAVTRGLWWSADRGQTWSQKNMGSFNVRALAIKDQGTGTYPKLLAGTVSGKIFRSTNNGDNWTQLTAPTGVTSVTSIRYRTDNAQVYMATNNGVFLSTNNGDVWTGPGTGMTDLNVLSLKVVPNAQAMLYAGTATTVYRSTNGGTTWTQIDNGLGRMPISSIAVNGSSYWTVSRTYPLVGKYDGTSWSTQTITGFAGEQIFRHPSNSYLFTVGAVGQQAVLYRSTDAGVTYSALYTSPSASGNIFKGITYDPQTTDRMYVYGKDGTTANLYVIPNYGTGTREPYTISGSTSNTVNDVAVVSGTGTIYYAVDNVGVYKSTSGPSNGNQVYSGMTARSLALNLSQPNTVYAAGSSAVVKSNDAGSSWGMIRVGDFKRVIMSPGYPNSAGNILVLSNDGMKIYYQAGGSSSWMEVQGTLPTPINDIRGEVGPPAAVYVATDQGGYKSISVPSSSPTLVSPIGGVTVGIVPTLTWNSVSGATGYHLQVSTNSQFTSPVVDVSNLTTTSYSPTNLGTGPGGTSGSVYYWRVAANNFVGDGAFSNYDSFNAQPSGSITLTTTAFWGADNLPHPRLNINPVGQGTTFYIYRYSCPYGQGDCGSWPYYLLDATTGTTYDDNSITPRRKGSNACHNSLLSSSLHGNI